MSDKRQEGQVAGNLTRRDFLKGTAIGAAGLIAGSMLLPRQRPDKAKSHIPEKWIMS